MKRLNIAMLGEQAQEQVQEQQVIDENNEALATDQDAAQIQQQGAEIEEIQGVVQETQDAADCICQTAEKIEQMPEVSQEVVQIAQEQIAYFAKRTGMKMSGVTTAMESYSDGKVGNKEALVKQMNLAVESLEKGIVVAQEGIVDRIKNKLSLIFTSTEKLKKELAAVSEAFDNGEPKTETIKEPAFAAVLNSQGKDELAPADVLALATSIAKISGSKELEKAVKDMAALTDAVTTAMTKSTFIAKDEQIAKIEEVTGKVKEMYVELKEKLEYKGERMSADVQPLTAKDKEKLKAKVEELLDTSGYKTIEKELDESVAALQRTSEMLANKRLIGVWAKDMRRARAALTEMGDAFSEINNFMKLRFEVAHACVKYIKASTAGKAAAKQQTQAQA